ncbi:hypothetical protein KUTeg_015399 [Tegillarca granosa]|uniref:Uncharacterized protein n=1 Tax=Tegillarca granosa TaxID=220873 RepID=A0ABQ9EUH8_TEGGR|nr:hypothetical protein KUTeg_015399 [Tegillarca granosa]
MLYCCKSKVTVVISSPMGSDITDISVVRNMPNLEVCSVSVNSITTLEDFSHCPHLQELYIRKNKIASLKEICHLKKLKKLLVKESELVESKEKGEEYSGGEEDDEDTEDTETTNNTDTEDKTETNHLTEETGKHHQHMEDKKNDQHLGGTKPTARSMLDPVTLTWEETNKIRGELGLKPLPYEKMTSPKPASHINVNSSRNAHVLQAVLILIRELDDDSLEIVGNAIKKKLEKNSSS